jgi:tRNA (cytidine/uridine-2'-O-)-methyltransferase
MAAWPVDRLIRLPMVPGNRSLNLSNAAAVVIYEAWRQLHFAGGH